MRNKYDSLTKEEIIRGLKETDDAIAEKAKSIADGGPPLPADLLARAQFRLSNTKALFKLQDDYEELIEALTRKT
jgi:hypothetical protein